MPPMREGRDAMPGFTDKKPDLGSDEALAQNADFPRGVLKQLVKDGESILTFRPREGET